MNFKVYRDDWGIPHLRAGSADALARAQGWNAAVDRAWQIEVERNRFQGTSASFLGASAAGWDRFARQARLDDTARRCFEALDESTATWVRHYVAGVNEGMSEGVRRAPQFAETGLVPRPWEPWVPLGIWLGAHVLFAGFPTKIWREEVARALGDDAVELFSAEGANGSGSNGWLVGADRTAHGAPLIAGDPHRPVEDPGVYQQIRLACDEFDVLGLAVPGVPGIAHFGHAGSVAWAITNAMADYQDLYRERLRETPGGGLEALGPEGWRPVRAHTETVEVAGEDPQEIEVLETDRGPVVVGGRGDVEVLSLRTPPRVTSDLGFAALPALLRARTTGDVDRALDGWAEPVNVVLAADTAGGLLHRVAGRVPRRPRENLLRTVPAWEAAYVWRGWRALPRAAVGAVAVMANERGVAEPLGVEFAAPHRAARIRELLGARRMWTAEGMASVHMDTRLDSVRPLLAAVDRLDGLGEAAAGVRSRLAEWDRRMDANSAEAALYAELRAAVVRRLAAHPFFDGLAKAVADGDWPDELLPWTAFTPRVGFALEKLLGSAFLPPGDVTAAVRGALEEVAAERAGSGRREPVWGDRHRLAPWHALPGGRYDTAPEGGWPGLSGDHDCVLATTSVPGVTDLSWRGPSARYVWDLARRENSRWIVPLGASGTPGDPHQRDQLPLWLTGALAPVVTDWHKLTEETPHDDR